MTKMHSAVAGLLGLLLMGAVACTRSNEQGPAETHDTEKIVTPAESAAPAVINGPVGPGEQQELPGAQPPGPTTSVHPAESFASKQGHEDQPSGNIITTITLEEFIPLIGATIFDKSKWPDIYGFSPEHGTIGCATAVIRDPGMPGPTSSAETRGPVSKETQKRHDDAVEKAEKEVAPGKVIIVFTPDRTVQVPPRKESATSGAATNISQLEPQPEDKDYLQAKEYLDRQEFAQAYSLLLKAAERGHREAQFSLGSMYYVGSGTAQSDVEALRWFLAAAEQGHVLAQFNVAKLAFEKKELKVGNAEIVKWMRKAAEGGLDVAQYNLGNWYTNGEFVHRNAADAAKWYLAAATQGHALSQLNIGICYYSGKGVEENRKLAKEWLEKAATQDVENAKAALRKLF